MAAVSTTTRKGTRGAVAASALLPDDPKQVH